MILFDTSIAIPIRDGERAALERLQHVPGRGYISIITHVELINGIGRGGADPRRREMLDIFLQGVDQLDLNSDVLVAYRRIVEAAGHARAKIPDRLIAATALAHDLPLATRNVCDVRDVPGLRVEDWS